MKIRKANYKDQKFVKKLDEENMKPIIEASGQKYSGLMLDSFNPSKCFIIETNGPIGFAYFKITKNKLNIWSIQIVKNKQGKGFGRNLMDHIITFAKEKKLKKIILEAHDSNEQATEFYDKFGFKRINKSNKKHKIFFEYPLK